MQRERIASGWRVIAPPREGIALFLMRRDGSGGGVVEQEVAGFVVFECVKTVQLRYKRQRFEGRMRGGAGAAVGGGGGSGIESMCLPPYFRGAIL